jgi:hypothetical protein
MQSSHREADAPAILRVRFMPRRACVCESLSGAGAPHFVAAGPSCLLRVADLSITPHSRRPSVVPSSSHLNLSRRSPSTDCPQLTCAPQPSRIISALTCRTRRLGVSSSGLLCQSPLTQHTQHQATSIRPSLGRNRLPRRYPLPVACFLASCW